MTVNVSSTVNQSVLPTDVWENKSSVRLDIDRSGVRVTLTYQVQRSLLTDKKRIKIQSVSNAEEEAWEYTSVKQAEKRWKDLTKPVTQLNS